MILIKSDGIYVDCTLGGAGHSRKILEKLNAEGHSYAFDQDRVAIENAERELKTYIEKNKVKTSTAKQAKSREKKLEKIEVLEKALKEAIKNKNN